MAIALRDSAISDDQPGSSSWALTMPTHQTNDLLITAASGNANGRAMLTPSGHTEDVAAEDRGANSLLVFHKIAASGSETITIADADSDEKIAIVAAFSGVDTTTPIDVALAYSDGNSTSPSHAGLTSVQAGWAIAIMGHDDGSDNSQSGHNNGTSSGWTAIEEDGQGRGGGPFPNPSAGGVGIAMGYKAVAALTASGSHEESVTGTETHYSATMIIREAAGAAAAQQIRNRLDSMLYKHILTR